MKTEPVMAFALLLSMLLAVFGVVIDVDTIGVVAAAVLPLIAGLFQRSKVTPV